MSHGSKSGGPTIRPLRAHHAALEVSDVERAIGFLTNVLGFIEVERHDVPGARAWAASREGFQIHLAGKLDRPRGGPRRVPHVAIEVADIDEARASLRARGIEFTDFGKIVFVADPDGNLFELRPAAALDDRS
jgi:catechol 2,3-dioxygenase-like lactoylglutathione lyase family enzyme